MSEIFVGEFLTGTGGLGTTVNLGVPFEPDLVIFFMSGVTGAGDQATTGQWSGIGWALANGDMAAIGTHYDHGIAPGAGVARGGCALADDCCVLTMVGNGNDSTSIDGKLELQSMTGGVVLEVANAFATSRSVIFVAVQGVEAEAGILTTPAGTGVQTISGHGFRGDAVLFMAGTSALSGVPSANGSGFGLAFGMASATAQGAVCANGFTGTGSSPANGYGYWGECIAILQGSGGGNVQRRAEFDGFTADGFELDWLETGAGTRIPYLILRGAVEVINFNTPTDENPFSVAGLGASPLGAIFASAARLQSTQDTPTTTAILGFGAVGEELEQKSVGMVAVNGTNSSTRRSQRGARAMLRSGTGGTVVRQMEVSQFDANGFTAAMDLTGNQSAFQVFGLVFLSSLMGDATLEWGGSATQTLVLPSIYASDVPKTRFKAK